MLKKLKERKPVMGNNWPDGEQGREEVFSPPVCLHLIILLRFQTM